MTATRSQVVTGALLEPALVRIPAASFLMGSDRGQDCERPVHRVSIDEFQLAATQVTNAEYARFLAATSTTPPPFWQDANLGSQMIMRCVGPILSRCQVGLEKDWRRGESSANSSLIRFPINREIYREFAEF